MAQNTDVKEAVAIVRRLIWQRYPFKRGTDDVGHKVNVHYNDGEYDATLNYETRAWLIADGMIEAIDDALTEADSPCYVEELSSYEVGIMLPKWAKRMERS